MDFVASNGAQVVVAGKLVDREVFSHAALRRLKSIVDLFDNPTWPFSTCKITPICDDGARFERRLDGNLPNPVRALNCPTLTPASSRHPFAAMTPLGIWLIFWARTGEGFIVRAFRPQVRSTSCSAASAATGISQVMAAHNVQARRGYGVRRRYERLRNLAHGRNQHRHGQQSIGHQADFTGNRHERPTRRPTRNRRFACNPRSIGFLPRNRFSSRSRL